MMTGGLPLYLSPLLSPILLLQSYYFFLESQGFWEKMDVLPALVKCSSMRWGADSVQSIIPLFDRKCVRI